MLHVHEPSPNVLMAASKGARHTPSMVNDDTSRQSIGDRLKLTREALGLNQAAFARLVGISPQGINNYEKGTQRPQLDQAFQICRATGATLDWIYFGDRSGLPGRILDKLPPPASERRTA